MAEVTNAVAAVEVSPVVLIVEEHSMLMGRKNQTTGQQGTAIRVSKVCLATPEAAPGIVKRMNEKAAKDRVYKISTDTKFYSSVEGYINGEEKQREAETIAKAVKKLAGFTDAELALLGIVRPKADTTVAEPNKATEEEDTLDDLNANAEPTFQEEQVA